MALPGNAKLHPLALKELQSLDPGGSAALYDAFGRRALGNHLPRESAPFPIGKKKRLDEIRVTVGGNEFRLLYSRLPTVERKTKMKMKIKSPRQSTEVVAEDSVPPVYLGLYAYIKKRKDAPKTVGETAWNRLQAVLKGVARPSVSGTA